MARIALVELPAFKLLDEHGFNWTALRSGDPLGGKQILAAQLEGGGFDVEIVNLKNGNDEIPFGSVRWRDKLLRKIAVGTSWERLEANQADVWGVTVNYLQEREVACQVIRHLADQGGRVVVGGSDPFAEPNPYLEAGATAVVRDKSGAANLPLVDRLTSREPREPLTGIVFPDGTSIPARIPPMTPQDWPLPSSGIVAQTLGPAYWEAPLPESLAPIGAVMLDLGCDRHCDFCETPTYRVGYRWMNPDRSLAWLEAQKKAGARSTIVLSDQFLGRVLWKQGRTEVLEILAGARKLGMPLLWGNGLEIQKATIGRSLPKGDPTPDEELVEAIWGWDGKVGCAQAYIPAERPTAGPKAYKKLLPWQHHVEMLKSIVRAGLPDITYGIIVGLPDDSHEGLEALFRAVGELRSELKSMNPGLRFRVVPYAIRPIPGTPAAERLRKQGLLRFDDPSILGGFWTACADTHHMSYEAVSDWQYRFSAELSDNEPGFQGITGITGIESASKNMISTTSPVGFSWSPEQLAFKEEVSRFAQGLNDNLLEREREGEFPQALWQRCAEYGLLGLPIPQDYGGQGKDLLTTMLAMEAMGYGCKDNGLNLAINAQVWTVEIPLLHFGTEPQKARYLPRLCGGTWIGAHAMTESEAGSDAYHLSTRAERKGNGYVINGTKTLITLSPRADVVLFFATVDPDLGRWGLTAFLVERGTEGFHQSDPLDKMGLRTAPMGELVFDDCFLPETQRLGQEGAGASIAAHALEWDRCFILSSQLGAMERQLETAVSYARSRKQFGQPIGKFQAVSHRLADMKLRVEVSRLLLYRAGWLKAQGKAAMLEGALAKLFISESFVTSSFDAIRTHGGQGYLKETEIERDLRDAVGGTIYAGTSDIQRNIIARLLGL